MTRNCEALGSFLLTCATTGLYLIAVVCLLGAPPRGQPWTPAVTRPHGRDGLSARRMAVLSTFREPSLCRHVPRELMRSAWLDFTTIVPATPCHPRHDVEPYRQYTYAACCSTLSSSLFPAFIAVTPGSHAGLRRAGSPPVSST